MTGKISGNFSDLFSIFRNIFESRALANYSEDTVIAIINSFTAFLKTCQDPSKTAIQEGLLNEVLCKSS